MLLRRAFPINANFLMNDSAHLRRYSAFISYRHADNMQEGRRWAEWLHRALERYTVPPELIGTLNLRGEPIRDSLYPIFRDEDELPANADLASGIQAALEGSGYLIVLCSPRSAVSPWVRKEVREFKSLGRSDRILAVIIAGEPNADDPSKTRDGILPDEECFCEELRYGAVNEDKSIDWNERTEPTAADLRPVGTRAEGFVTAEAYREHLVLNTSLSKDQIIVRVESYRQQLDHALLKVIAGLLGVHLGVLVDRDAAHRAALAEHEAAVQREIAERERSLADEARKSEEQAIAARSVAERISRWLAFAVLISGILALLSLWFWWMSFSESRRANSALTKIESLLSTASQGERASADRAHGEHRFGEALACMERALRYTPSNVSVLQDSAGIAFGEKSRGWHTRSIIQFPRPIRCIAFDPSGQWIAGGGWDKTVGLFDSSTGTEFYRIPCGEAVFDICFSPDSRFLGVASGDKKVKLIERSNRAVVSEMEFDGHAQSLCFSSDGQFLVAAGGKTLRTFNLATKQQSAPIRFKGGENEDTDIKAVAARPTGYVFVVTLRDKSARLIDVLSGTQIGKVQLEGACRSMNFSPDGQSLGINGGSESVPLVVDATTGEPRIGTDRASIESLRGDIVAIRFSPDGKHLAVGGRHHRVQVIDVITKGIVFDQHVGSTVGSLDFSPDGRLLAAACDDAVVVFDLLFQTEISRTEFSDAVVQVVFSQDGRYLAAGSRDGTIRVMEPTVERMIRRSQISGPSTQPDSLAEQGSIPAFWSSDNRWSKVTDSETTDAWFAALRLQFGQQFRPEGQLMPGKPADLISDQQCVSRFVDRGPESASGWQHAVLRWSSVQPERRTVSPWTNEPIRIAAGIWFMLARAGEQSISATADDVPWHPLEPVSLARQEPRPEAIPGEAQLTRQRFLARLTINRLRHADEQLYGRETLVKYAAWSAKIMHEELKLDAEAREMIAFALTLTPPERRQELLELKAAIDP